MNDRTNRSALSLATPLFGPGPRFMADEPAGSGADSGGVDNDVVDRLVDDASKGRQTPKSAAPDMSAAELKELQSLAADLFHDDPDIGSAALKKLAARTGNGDKLTKLVEAKRQQPAPDPVDDDDDDQDGRAPDASWALDFYSNHLNTGIDKIMAGSEMQKLRDVAKRTQGDKFDREKWDKAMRSRYENRVLAGFQQLGSSGQKIEIKSLNAVLNRAEDDIIGLIRSTIGDPTGLGRHASATAPVPGSDIPEERTRLPDPEEARRDPTGTLSKARDADEAAFLKRLAGLRAGQDGTRA